MKSKIIFSGLIIMILSINLGADMTELFDNYEKYLNLKKLSEFENLFVHSEFFNNALDEKKNWVEEIGEFQYTHEIVSSEEIDESMICYGLRQLVNPDNTELLEISWMQWELQKADDEYLIANEKLLDYLEIVNTELNVNIFPGEKKLIGNHKIKLKMLKDEINKLIFYADTSVTPSEIKINNVITEFAKNENFIIIDLADKFKTGDVIDLQIDYSAQPNSGFFYLNSEDGYSSWLGGWYPMLWGNKSFSAGKISISVPEHLYAITNGTLQKKENQDEWTTYYYEIQKPANFTFAYGRYSKYSLTSDSLEYRVYLLDENKGKADLYLNSSIEIIDYLKKVYGFYPFDEYAIIEVTANYPGSSENGFTAIGKDWMRDDDYHFPTFAHEIGHLWWGNYIIGKGALMSEAFAQFSYYLFMENKFGKQVAENYLNWGEWRYDQAKFKYFAQIEPDSIKNKALASTSLTNHTLANTKGMSVLVALRNTIGQKAMLSGIRAAQKQYPHSFLTIDELLDEIQNFTDIDLMRFRKDWIYSTNCPEITGNSLSGAIELSNWDKNLEVEIGLYSSEYEEIRKLLLKPGTNIIDLKSSFEPNAVVIDPNYKLVLKTDDYQNLEHLGKAITAWYSGDKNLAVKETKKQIEINPASLISQIYAGKLLYHFAQEPDSAIKSLKYVLEQPQTYKEFPQYLPTIYTTLSRIYYEKGNTEKGLAYKLKINSVINNQTQN
jgi:peptidase M1-like protein